MTDRSTPAPDAPPKELRLAKDKTELELVYTDGPRILTAESLRAACRCADCARRRHDGTFAAPAGRVAVTALQPIGTYGINIVFSDGHDRGIYSWGYIRTLTATGN